MNLTGEINLDRVFLQRIRYQIEFLDLSTIDLNETEQQNEISRYVSFLNNEENEIISTILTSNNEFSAISRQVVALKFRIYQILKQKLSLVKYFDLRQCVTKLLYSGFVSYQEVNKKQTKQIDLAILRNLFPSGQSGNRDHKLQRITLNHNSQFINAIELMGIHSLTISISVLNVKYLQQLLESQKLNLGYLELQIR